MLRLLLELCCRSLHASAAHKPDSSADQVDPEGYSGYEYAEWQAGVLSIIGEWLMM